MVTKNNDEVSDSIAFIDIVFTAMVTIGLTPELLQANNVSGMLSERWVQAALRGCSIALTSQEWLHLFTFLLALLTLLLSWFGVHVSLKSKPILYDNVWGMTRFILDVALVLLYGAIFIFFRQLHVVLGLLALVYGLYLVWDVFKIFEYFKTYRKEYQRENRICSIVVTHNRQLVSLLFALLFIALWLFVSHVPQWAALVLALVFTGTYRIFKIYLREWLRKTVCTSVQ